MQTLGGTAGTQFENFTLENTSGLGLSANIIVRNVLTLSNGVFHLNTSDLYIGNTGSISGTFGSTTMIVTNSTGSLRKGFTTKTSFTFPIGDTTGIAEYSPVSFNLTNSGGFSSGSWIGVRIADEIHPENTSPSEYLSRYWRVGSLGVISPVFSADFYYTDDDIFGAEASIFATEYDDGSNRSVYSTVTHESNILSVTGMSSIEDTYADYTGEDGTAPTTSISTLVSDPTNLDPIAFTISFSEEVTGFDHTDISLTNGTTSGVTTSDNIDFDFDVTPTLDGDVIINANSGVATDLAGNDNIAAIADTIKYDQTNPIILISSLEPDPTNTNIEFTVTFSEQVTGFVSGDITVGNGNVSNFTESTAGIEYDVVVTPTTDGEVTVDIAGGVANDLACNGNIVASQFSVTYDITNPNVTLTATEPDPTNSSFTLTIEFDEGVTDFILTDLTLENCNAGSYAEVKEDTIFTVLITPIANGTVTVDLASGKAHDYAGNANNAATQFSIEYDGTKPNVSISTLESNPTNTTPFELTIAFTEEVNHFHVEDITVGNGSAGNFNTADSTTFTADITPTGSGLVTVSVLSGVAFDNAGNLNNAATQLSITYDEDAPVVSTLSPADGATGVSVTSNLQIVFNEIVNAVSGIITLVETGVGTVETFDVSTSDISGDGTKTITVDPTSPLSSLTDYHVLVDGTAFVDNAGNSFAGYSLATDWNFTSADISNPYITDYSPVDNALSVTVGSNLVLTFSEEVVKGSGNIVIYEASGPSIIETIPVGSPQVSVATDVVTIDPGSDFNGETEYYVLIDAGTFEDTNTPVANPFGGITNPAEWSFTTEDIAGPIVTSLNPANNDTDVAVSSNLIITFDEDVTADAGNITIWELAGPTEHETIAVGSVSITDNEVTINPTIDFSGETSYYVEIDATAFKDAYDNYYAGISGSSLWNFETEDITDPTVSISTAEVSPSNSSSFEITIEFSEEMKNFDNVGNITVTNGSASNLNTSDNITFTANITPATEGDVSVIIPAGVAQDLADNFNTVSNEITVEYDITSPTVEITSLQSGTINTDLEVTITFSEEINDLLTGNITVTNGTVSNLTNQVAGLAWDATITPTTDGTVTVDILLDEVTDLAGNGNIASDQFTIDYDATGPEISTLSPTNGSFGVTVSEVLEITFDETAYLNTGNVEIRYQSNDALFESIDVGSLGGNGTTTISIDPASDFDSETTYYVTISPEAFIDVLGNVYDGMTSGEWEFTTEDFIDPDYVTLSPTDDATSVAVNANLEITFTENISKNVGEITIMNADEGTEHEIINVAIGPVTVSTNIATINPSVDFIGETNYYVIVGDGTFVDASGNTFAGIGTLSSSEWNFYTEDVEPPTLGPVSPLDDATGVSIISNLVLTFSELVSPGSGYITIVDADAASNHEVIEINDAAVSFSANEVTINPTIDFDGLTNYYVLIDAGTIEDAFGNVYAGISDPTKWNFFTVDASAPMATDFSPIDNSSNLTNNFDLVITFNEEVVKNSGFIYIENSTTSITHEAIDAASTNVTVSSNIVTINPNIDFEDLNSYYVQMDYGVFQDIDGNNYSGISDAVSWNFTIGDNVAPSITSLSPADDATGVSLTANLEIEFSENVVANAGNITIVN
ncbi:MAG: hypothetical protein C0597_17230 [Marinilabiliales bacterium]|nr:MAG: hypothetical protein C0597_17230 [Marinilabiliales bacterium]